MLTGITGTGNVFNPYWQGMCGPKLTACSLCVLPRRLSVHVLLDLLSGIARRWTMSSALEAV